MNNLEINWLDQSTDESSFKVFRSKFSTLSYASEVASVAYQNNQWNATGSAQNLSLISTHSNPSSTGERFRIQLSDDHGGDFFYGVSAINSQGASNRIASNKITLSGVPLPIMFLSVANLGSVDLPPQPVGNVYAQNLGSESVTTPAPTTTDQPRPDTPINVSVIVSEQTPTTDAPIATSTTTTEPTTIAPTTTLATTTTIAPFIGELRRVTKTWENAGNNTIIGEILEIEFISASNGKRYVRDNGSKIWSNHAQYLNFTEAFVATTQTPTTTLQATTTEESEFTETFCMEYNGTKRTYRIQADGNYLRQGSSNANPSSVGDYPLWKTDDGWWVWAQGYTTNIGNYYLSWWSSQFDPRTQTGSRTALSSDIQNEPLGDLVKTENLFNPSSVYFILHGAGECPS